jgi:hypothetical protein
MSAAIEKTLAPPGSVENQGLVSVATVDPAHKPEVKGFGERSSLPVGIVDNHKK